jgi:hypothetical protein
MTSFRLETKFILTAVISPLALINLHIGGKCRATEVKDELSDYFISTKISVEWQNEMKWLQVDFSYVTIK